MTDYVLGQFVFALCEITDKNEDVILVKEILCGMRNLLDIWGYQQKERNGLYNRLIRLAVEKYSDCKRSEDIDAICRSMIIYEEDDRITEVPDVREKLAWIDSVPLIEQRSQEWYTYRHGVITASSMGELFGTESSYNKAVKEKVKPLQMTPPGAACLHGIKYEAVAQAIYEKKYEVKVTEYGCIKHKTIDHIGASPDGIVTSAKNAIMIGRMLEIKCPYSRKIKGVPPYKYWIQVQIQLEVCDLEYCDFLECKLEEMSEDAFYTAIAEDTMNTEYYGIVVDYTKGDAKRDYKYSGVGQTDAEFREWYDATVDEVLDSDAAGINKVCYWKLAKMSNITIKRDREWFERSKVRIQEFWDEVMQKRELYETDKTIFDKGKGKNKSGGTPTGDKSNSWKTGSSYKLKLDSEYHFDDDYC